MTITNFQYKILAWYRENKRQMPWRETKDPYKILVSEIMLQQTQVARVLPKYLEFLAAFPTLKSLSTTKKAKLLRVWQGLGYWRRALYLQQTAQRIIRNHGGRFPKDTQTLETFPGIGPYTARALVCFAFGSTEAFLDTNIRRVYLYFFFPKRKNVPDKEILKIAQRAVNALRLRPSFCRDFGEIKEWHSALFDYGAMVLKDKRINKKSRHYRRQSPFKGSFRWFRTKAVRFILAEPNQRASEGTLNIFLAEQLKHTSAKNRLMRYSVKQILAALAKDGLIKKVKNFYMI